MAKMAKSRLAVQLAFIAVSLALIAAGIAHIQVGDVEWSLLAASLFFAFMGWNTRGRST